ncbi:unnamed protein product, partial [Ectocarpus sp. 13 AM-2016]
QQKSGGHSRQDALPKKNRDLVKDGLIALFKGVYISRTRATGARRFEARTSSTRQTPKDPPSESRRQLFCQKRSAHQIVVLPNVVAVLGSCIDRDRFTAVRVFFFTESRATTGPINVYAAAAALLGPCRSLPTRKMIPTG